MDESTRKVTRLWTLAQPRVSAFVTTMVLDFRDCDDRSTDCRDFRLTDVHGKVAKDIMV